MSFRSVYTSMMEILSVERIQRIAVIAEGVAERHNIELIEKCRNQNVMYIGPSTVGGIMPGVFRIGNTCGILENILELSLFRQGNVGIVTKSGGMLNELVFMCQNVTTGVYQAIQIGGDSYPGTNFMDHLMF